MKWGNPDENLSVHWKVDYRLLSFNRAIGDAICGTNAWWQVKQGSENFVESRCNAIESTLYAALFRKVKTICESNS